MSAAGACGRTDNSLLLTGDDEDGGVSMNLSTGPSPQLHARGRVSLVCPAAAAASAAVTTAPTSSSCGACNVPPVLTCAVPNIVDLDDKELVHPFRALYLC
jgi:hypothetical protein